MKYFTFWGVNVLRVAQVDIRRRGDDNVYVCYARVGSSMQVFLDSGKVLKALIFKDIKKAIKFFRRRKIKVYREGILI